MNGKSYGRGALYFNEVLSSATVLTMVVFGALGAFGADEIEQMAPREELVFVEKGKPLAVVYEGEAWKTEGEVLVGSGPDNWLLANRGLVEGDFCITARLTVRGLHHSAARFSFNMNHAFGFEGNHGKVYITGALTPNGRAIAWKPPAEIGIRDGEPFTLEVVRKGNRISFLIDGREAYGADVSRSTFDCFGFEARRATIELESLAAEGHFSPGVYKPGMYSLWHHPKTELQNTQWHGPFVNLSEEAVLTVVNVEDGIQAFVSDDDGKSWAPRGKIEVEGTRFGVRDMNADTLLLKTRAGTLLCVFLNIANEKISWDYKRQEPLPDMKRFTWIARSDDDGRTWRDVRILQRGYCGALRDMIELTTGELVLVEQDAANNPGRHLSLTYFSQDDGRTWVASNVMDIGGKGDHAGSIEGTLTELRDGRLWILLRSYHGHFYECFSSDRGRTWTKPVPSEIKASGSPGILKRLESGRLVLFWNRFAENRPRRLGRREELSMAFSEDDGKTWSEPVILLRLRGQRVSYPLVFERRPGELWVTVWQGATFIKLQEDDFASATSTGGPNVE